MTFTLESQNQQKSTWKKIIEIHIRFTYFSSHLVCFLLNNTTSNLKSNIIFGHLHGKKKWLQIIMANKETFANISPSVYKHWATLDACYILNTS